MPPERRFPAKQKATIGWLADETAAELQHYRCFIVTIQRLYEKERSRNTSMPKEFLNNFLAYLDHVVASETENNNTAFGQAIMHRRRQIILNIERGPDGNPNFGDFMMRTLFISRAEMQPFQGYDQCEVAYQFCADVAMVIETLAKYTQTTARFSGKDFSDLKKRVTDLENDVNVALGLKPEVPVGDSIRTLLNRTIVACRRLQTSAEPSRRLTTLLEDLIKDLDNLMRNLTGRKLDRTMITEIELKIWSQAEQFNSLINTSEEEVTHKSRTASGLLMQLLGGIGRTIGEVLSLLGINSCFRMPQEVTSPAPPVQRTSTTRQIHTAKTYSPITSSNNSTGISGIHSAKPTLKKHILGPHGDKYVCTLRAYGCECTFSSKTGWKGHINAQHMRFETWRCDIANCAIQPPPIPTPLPAPPETYTVENGVASSTGKRKSPGRGITKALEPTTPQPRQEQDPDSNWDFPGKKGSRKRSKTDYEETEEPANTTLRETQKDPAYGWAVVNKQDDRKGSRKKSRIEDTAVNFAPNPDPDAEVKHARDAQMMQASPYFPQPEAPSSASEMPKPFYFECDRLDLFTRHLKRRHAPPFSASPAEKASFNIEAVRQRCHVRLREPPTSTICPFCPEHPTFEKWDNRLEHMGRHLEKQDVDYSGEIEDLALRKWMIAQGFLERGEGASGWRLVELSPRKKSDERRVYIHDALQLRWAVNRGRRR